MHYYKTILLFSILCTLGVSGNPRSLKEILETEDWTLNQFGCKDWYLAFENDILDIYLSCMDNNFHIRGEYSQKGNMVTLHHLHLWRVNYEVVEANLALKTLNNAKCEIKEILDSVKYLYQLTCRGTKFYNRGIYVPKDKMRKIGNREVVTMGGVEFVTKDFVRIREEPSVEGKIVRYLPALGRRTSEYMPKETMVEVFARTKDKDTVKGWTNYWYYIDSGWNRGVWVFGEYLEKAIKAAK